MAAATHVVRTDADVENDATARNKIERRANTFCQAPIDYAKKELTI